jgi:ribosome-associated protein
MIERASRRPKKRRATKPRPAAREQRLETKKRRGQVKASRGKRPGRDD